MVGGQDLGHSSMRVSFASTPVQKLMAPALPYSKMNVEAVLSARRSIVLCVLLGVPIFFSLKWRDVSARQQIKDLPAPTIVKQAVNVANRTFDPTMPPAGMPSLTSGEDAECDSNFLSNASVSGESRQNRYNTRDPHHLQQVKVTLQLNITIWVPPGVTQRVVEHEDGHRQISEYYYQTADKLAERIAATYMGKQVELTGTDLNAESSKALQQMATDITDEYNKELNPGPTQQYYDRITDHSRTDISVSDAVAAAVRDVKIVPSYTTANPEINAVIHRHSRAEAKSGS